MRRMLVISVAAIVVAAGAGGWLWLTSDWRLEQRINDLPGVASVTVADSTAIDIDPSTGTDQLRETLRQLATMRDREDIDELRSITVDMGPVEFRFDEPELSIRELSAIAAGTAEVSSVGRADIDAGWIHVVVDDVKDVLPTTRQLLRTFGRDKLASVPYLTVSDRDSNQLALDVSSSATENLSFASRQVDLLARAVGESDLAFKNGEVAREFTALTAEAGSRADLIPAHDTLTKAFGERRLDLTLESGDLQIFNIGEQAQARLPLAAVLMFVERLETTGVRVTSVAADLALVGYSANDATTLNRVATAVGDADLPPDANIVVQSGERTTLRGTPQQIGTMAPMVADLQRAKFDARFEDLASGHRDSLVIEPRIGADGDVLRDPRTAEVRAELVTILRRAVWPGKLNLRIYGLSHDGDAGAYTEVRFSSTSNGHAEEIEIAGYVGRIQTDELPDDEPAAEFIKAWNAASTGTR